GEQVAEAAAGDNQPVRRLLRALADPPADLGVLDPDVLHPRPTTGSAVEAVLGVAVVAHGRLAENGEVEEAAAIASAVKAGERPANRRVPHPRAVDRPPSYGDALLAARAAGAGEAAGRNPDALALRRRPIDAGLNRLAVVGLVVGRRAAVGDRD